MAQKGPKRPKFPIVRLVGQNWRNSLERACNKLGHIRGDALEPFHWSKVAIGRRLRPSKWAKGPKRVILWPK